MQIRGRSVDVVRERPVAKPTSAAGALPAPRARDGKVSLGLAKDIRFDYFKVRNIPAHVGRTRKESQTMTKAMFNRVGSQASRA